MHGVRKCSAACCGGTFFHQSPGADNAHADLVNIVMPVEKNVKEIWRVAVGVDPGAPPGLNHWCGDVELLARDRKSVV